MRIPISFAFALAMLLLTSGCQNIRHTLVTWLTPAYEVKRDESGLVATFEDLDASRERIPITLKIVAEGFDQITDIQFAPDGTMVVLQKDGKAIWFSPADGQRGELLAITVATASESGLLGLAFHPAFADNGRFYLHYNVQAGGKLLGRIAEWNVANSNLRGNGAKEVRTILDVEQPYPNHNGGQLTFGPDGFLYVGWGDGGWLGDPHDAGQNPQTMLGSLLRIDIDSPASGRSYGIPRDNPYADGKDALAETWAYGLRNPWRYSFDSTGRLFLADVGQGLWEEVNLIEAGKNYGWNIREGANCYKPKKNCRTEGLADPIYEYGREDGGSITGGFLYEGSRVPALKGKYVFGDFLSGRLWAIDVPADGVTKTEKAFALGKWPILPSTFGRDLTGELYVADFYDGIIYRLGSD
jgi:glucose/arabinose dehydrogenase